MRIILTPLILSFIILPAISSSQVLTNKTTEEFIQSLLEDSEGVKNFVLPEELQLSERLNIKYEDVKHKFLISYDIDPFFKNKIISYTSQSKRDMLQSFHYHIDQNVLSF